MERRLGAPRREGKGFAIVSLSLALVCGAVALHPGSANAHGGKTSPSSWSQIGIASWYGPEFHGQQTASGAKFDCNGLTAAHPTLPLGSRIRVTDTNSGKRVEVTVTDRMPAHKTRILDLSMGAAKKLGMLGRGTSKVVVALVDKDKKGAQKTQTAAR